MNPRDDNVTLGRISGLHGVRGWLKIYSYTTPPDAIGSYPRWDLMLNDKRQQVQLEKLQVSGNRLLAKLSGFDDRDAAAVWVGAEIEVQRQSLPPLDEGEFYWADLEGLAVETTLGFQLGIVRRLFETGANDVMVVSGDRERLIPWVRDQVVKKVDLDGRLITVDWDPEF